MDLSKREFFAHLALSLDTHGKSKDSPRLSFDIDESYRRKLADVDDIHPRPLAASRLVKNVFESDSVESVQSLPLALRRY